MRRTSGESVAILHERVEIIGGPRPIVERPSRHDDEDLGPSIVRAALDDVFHSANLARTDVSGSSFELCTFEAASLDGAKLYRTPRLLGLLKRGRDQTNLPLSETQRHEVEWCADAPAPGGG